MALAVSMRNTGSVTVVRHLLHRQLNHLERQLGGSVDHLRHLADISLRAFFKLMLTGPAATHRRTASLDMLHAVRIAAAAHEDCGSCLQIAVNLARRDGMAVAVLGHLLNGQSSELPEPVRTAFQFARSVLNRDGQDEHWRMRLRENFGEEMVVELSLAIAMARVFPVLKRGMGFATQCGPKCGRVAIEDEFTEASALGMSAVSHNEKARPA